MEETITRLVKTSMIIPFYKILAAGFPSPAQDYSEPEIDLSKVLQPNPTSTYIIRIKGDSMREANMPDGCMAVVDRSIKPYSGAIIVAVLNGEFTVKRLVKAGRNWVLHPENPFYKPILIPEGSDFQVWGVITYTVVDQQ